MELLSPQLPLLLLYPPIKPVAMEEEHGDTIREDIDWGVDMGIPEQEEEEEEEEEEGVGRWEEWLLSWVTRGVAFI